MVVLESGSSSTTKSKEESGTMAHQFSQYVQPLPTEYDAKNSPLAMLTKTCERMSSVMQTNSGSAKLSKIAGTSDPSLVSRPKSSCSSNASSLASPVPRSSPKSRRSPSDDLDDVKEAKRPKMEEPLAASPPKGAKTSRINASAPFISTMATSVSLTSPKTVASPVCTDPLCQDVTCPTFMYRQAQLVGFSQQAYLSAIARTGLPIFPPPPHLGPGVNLPFPTSLPTASSVSSTVSSSSAVSTSTSSASSTSPFVCNWMQGSDCCGRRFSSREDLMGHLRTHTTTTTSAPGLTPVSSPLLASPLHLPIPAGHPSALAALQAQAARSSTPSLSLSPPFVPGMLGPMPPVSFPHFSPLASPYPLPPIVYP